MKPALLVLLPLCLLLTGCEVLPYPRELESTMLVGVLGMDQENGVILTAAEIPREERGEARLLAAVGGTMEESEAALKRTGEEYVALTHVTQIVVGEGADLRMVLEEALAAREIGQTATVWLVREGSAQKLMESVGGGAKRLNSMELNGGEKPPTVLEALVRMEESGEVTLPVLEERDGTLETVGERVWKEGKNGRR